MSPPSSASRAAKKTNTIINPDDEKIEIQPREYGYAKDMYTWEQLIQIIEEEKNLAKLSRSVPQQREYEVFRRRLLREWRSICDHILVSKFGFEKRLGKNPGSDEQNSTLWEAYPPLDQFSEVRMTLKPNDFPYYLPSHIEHWCLWKLCENVTDDEIEQAKRDLRSMHGDVMDFLHWRNPPHLKSLPDIDHAHILCLRREEETSTDRLHDHVR